MANLAKMVNNILEQLDNLRIDPSHCVKVRSPLSKCNACIDICPVKGIHWTGRSIDVNNCIECGLCASVCPSHSINYKNFSSIHIVKKVEELLSNFSEVYLYCSKQSLDKKIEQGIEVPCLGILSWECWLKLILSEKVKVYLCSKNCNECQIKSGHELFIKRLTKAEEISNKKITKVTVTELINNNNSMPEEAPFNKERRKFLGNIFKALVSIPEKIVSGSTGLDIKTDEKENSNLIENDKILRECLGQYPDLNEKNLISLPNIRGNCQFCKVCSTLCPQKAIKQLLYKDTYQLVLDKFLCNGCNLCFEVCYHKAIELKPFKFKELNDQFNVLATGKEFICSECGVPYKAIFEDKCPSCKNNLSEVK